jgi:RNA polymerase sigma-70 factor (TIGR02957 family)
MADEALLDELRPGAFAIAYRMLGSVTDAEDIVQEALLRTHRALEGGEEIASPRAYVATIVTRLGIDHLRSARVRRETYVGEWLPEPLATDRREDPAQQAETADSLSLAFLTVLERLTPEQRAAFLLREVFGYGYDEVAEVVGTSDANARQLTSRARRQVSEQRPRFEASEAERRRLADGFFAAARDGDMQALEGLLAHDVQLHGDGGGKVPALAAAVHGRVRVARTLLAWWKASAQIGAVSIERGEFNGAPGARMLDPEGRLVSVLVLEIADGRIQALRSVVNPDKLRHLGPVGNLGELLRGG